MGYRMECSHGDENQEWRSLEFDVFVLHDNGETTAAGRGSWFFAGEFWVNDQGSTASTRIVIPSEQFSNSVGSTLALAALGRPKCRM